MLINVSISLNLGPRLVLRGQPGFEAVPEAVIKEEIQKHGRIKP